jgi:GT2 family glycosyltransferase
MPACARTIPNTGETPALISPKPVVRLSILLVNHNGMRDLAECLDSVKQFLPPETEVILADNASTDGSVERVVREYPWVRVVRSTQNLGFAAGNNLAGREATGKFVLLLNTDTILLEPIAPVIDWLDEHAGHAVLTINMLDGTHVSRACTGYFPSPSRLILLRHMLIQPEHYGNEYAYDVDWVQGSFLLMRTEHWRALSGLDESYFMYAEDVDLCQRVHAAGWQCAYLPHVRYIHLGGYNPKRFPEQAASLGIYIRRHMKGSQKLVCWTILATGCLARTFFYGLKVVLVSDEKSRAISRSSWLAFKALLHMDQGWRTRERSLE